MRALRLIIAFHRLNSSMYWVIFSIKNGEGVILSVERACVTCFSSVLMLSGVRMVRYMSSAEGVQCRGTHECMPVHLMFKIVAASENVLQNSA